MSGLGRLNLTIGTWAPWRRRSERAQRRSLSVGHYLAALALAVAIPLVALAFYVSQRVADSEREAARITQMTTARSLAAVVDREIEKRVAIAWSLAQSRALRAGDWPEFWTEAKHTLAYLPDSWISVIDLDGRMLMITSQPLGTPLPTRPLYDAERRALATGTPTVSDVIAGSINGRLITFATVPVRRDGKPLYLLQLALPPEHFHRLLVEQRYPADWLLGVIDRNGNFVARLPDETGSHVGQPASEGWRAAVRRSPEGMDEHRSIEGDPIVEAYLSTSYGWTVGVSIGKGAIEAPLRRTQELLLAASLGCIALGLVLAWLIGRRFLRSTEMLHAAATDMAAEKPVAAATTGVHEIDRAVAAFAAASDLLGARAQERARAAELQQTLTRELEHRSNNLLAVIQAIAHRSLAGDASLEEPRKAFQQRLQALARTHRELTRSNFSGLDIGEIVRAELEPFAARTRIEGQQVMLGPQEAQNFSLAVHELATNAAKYGALSRPEGSVDIRWQVATNGEGKTLRFEWQERGGPTIVAPARRGFGSWLLNSLFKQAQFDYAPAGLRCGLDMPLGRGRPA
ncbi:MAG TPA: sensor histidine kinase [Xanthobacteraceae bacterium]|nr:sensor histidine kinase [Xanthobacteraceae bacterium]